LKSELEEKEPNPSIDTVIVIEVNTHSFKHVIVINWTKAQRQMKYVYTHVQEKKRSISLCILQKGKKEK